MQRPEPVNCRRDTVITMGKSSFGGSNGDMCIYNIILYIYNHIDIIIYIYIYHQIIIMYVYICVCNQIYMYSYIIVCIKRVWGYQ